LLKVIKGKLPHEDENEMDLTSSSHILKYDTNNQIVKLDEPSLKV